jgi:hypothetical protein
VGSLDAMRTPKKSRNLSFTQYNTQYEEQEKKKQRREEDFQSNTSGLRGRQNYNNDGNINKFNNNNNNSNRNNNSNSSDNNNDSSNNHCNNSNEDGNTSNGDRNISVSRGNRNISTKNHGSHTDYDQSNISTMHRNTNSSRFKSDENDRTRITSSTGYRSGSGGISNCDPDGGEEGNRGDRERDREGEEGGVEIWAMSLIGESTHCCAVLQCTALHSTALHYSTLLYCNVNMTLLYIVMLTCLYVHKLRYLLYVRYNTEDQRITSKI